MNALLNALLYWVGGWLRCRLIKVNEQPYLERYFVGQLFQRHIYLHRFLASDDPAQGVHDHPWEWSMSFILCGWYIEHRRWKQAIKRRFNFIGGDHFHRVELPARVYAWSLFIAGPPKPGRVWGMLHRVMPRTEAGWAERSIEWVFVPYDYGAPGNNPPPGKWWETSPRGRHQQRERREYVRGE